MREEIGKGEVKRSVFETEGMPDLGKRMKQRRV